jgi:general secretion pathway protein D
MNDGEVNNLGGLMQNQNTKSVSGVPGLMRIPVLGRLFSSESIEKSDRELLIALVPHVIRRPELTAENLRGVAVGNASVVKLNYAARRPGTPPGAAAAPAPGLLPAAPALPAVPQPAPQPVANVPLNFVPARVETTFGAAVTLNLTVENARDLFAAPLVIKFDPKFLQLSAVKPGGLLSPDGQPAIFTQNIRNDAGEASINVSRPPGAGGVSGSGTLLTVTFDVTAQGETSVSLSQVSLQNPQSQPIPTSPPTAQITVK